MQATNHTNPIKIALNGSIGLEVSFRNLNYNRLLIRMILTMDFCFALDSLKTQFPKNRISLQVTPPEEPTPILGVPCIVPSGQGGGINPSALGGNSGGGGGGGGSTLNINTADLAGSSNPNSPLQVPQDQSQNSAVQSPQHLQGTIV